MAKDGTVKACVVIGGKNDTAKACVVICRAEQSTTSIRCRLSLTLPQYKDSRIQIESVPWPGLALFGVDFFLYYNVDTQSLTLDCEAAYEVMNKESVKCNFLQDVPFKRCTF